MMDEENVCTTLFFFEAVVIKEEKTSAKPACVALVYCNTGYSPAVTDVPLVGKRWQSFVECQIHGIPGI